jgi:PKD repeat protein
VRVVVGIAGLAATAVVIGAVAALGAPGVAAATADAAPGTTLYVMIGGSGCSNDGPGTQAEPFCSIQSAADVVQAGQTVQIGSAVSGPVRGTVTISSKGTAAEPVNFVHEPTPAPVVLSQGTQANQPVIKFDGARYVTFSGLTISSTTTGIDGIDVDGSTNISLENLSVSNYSQSNGIAIDGTSSDVTVSRTQVTGDNGTGVLADAGATGVVLTTNRLNEAGTSIALNGATGSVVTSNTVIAECVTSPGGNGIVLANGSSGTVENNILDLAAGDACPVPGGTGLVVDAASAAGVTTRYNAFFSGGMNDDYSWEGTRYSTVADFQATVTGQGANDVALTGSTTATPAEESKAIDDANCSAPDELSTDILGKPRVSDPLAAANGPLASGGCHADRGAYERPDGLSGLTDTTSPAASTAGYRAQPVSAPFSVTIPAAVTSSWGEAVSYTVDFGDGGGPAAAAVGSPATHAYASTGKYTATITATDTGGSSVQATVTFYAMSATAPAVTLTAAPDVAEGMIYPDTADFTYSAGSLGWEVVSASMSYGTTDGLASTPRPPANWEYVYYKPGTYTATVTVKDQLGRTSTATTPITVGDELATISPVTGYSHAVGAHDTVKVPLTSLDGLCCRAAEVNVTVTSPKKAGSIVMYPDETSRPSLTTVQFQAGQTAENNALARTGEASNDVDVYNNSDGTLNLNVTAYGLEEDMSPAGYGGIGDTYIPVTPATVQPAKEIVAKHDTVIPVAGKDGVPADASAVVLEVTSSHSSAAGSFETWAEDNRLNTTLSGSSWAKGQQATGLATVPVKGRVILYNNSAGTAWLSAQVVGYYRSPAPSTGSVFLPAAPARMESLKLAGKHSVKVVIAGRDGVPAKGATAALVNLAASGSGAGGTLVAYPDGTARPSGPSVSFGKKQAVAGQAIVKVGSDGAIDVYNAGTYPVNLTVDLDGSYYAY